MARKRTVPPEVISEYEKAQDSAEHYNTIMWTLTPVLMGLSIYILYLVFSEDYNPNLKIGLLFIGAISLFYFSFVIETAHEKKKLKYGICKEL